MTIKSFKSHDELMSEAGLWANMHARRKAGKPKKKPGEKGYPKTLDIKDGTEGYVSNAQRAAVWANRADGGKGHPDNKKKKSKKEAYEPIKAHKVAGRKTGPHKEEELKAPTMLAKRDDEKKKIKTGLDRLRKALGPDHVMNKKRA